MASTAVSTVPKANQIVVEHGEIKGFMEAMTMGYRIDPPSLLAGLGIAVLVIGSVASLVWFGRYP